MISLAWQVKTCKTEGGQPSAQPPWGTWSDVLDYISYHGLLVLEIIIEMVCSCESDTIEAISAINDLSEMDLSECERIIDALAIERYS